MMNQTKPSVDRQLEKYVALMAEVKYRHCRIKKILIDRSNNLDVLSRVEYGSIDIRKILELIVLGSLVANKDVYAKFNEQFVKHYHAEKIIESIKKFNRDFYPIPVIDESDSKGYRISRSNKPCLTEGELIKIYKMCGRLQHANNPYRVKPDYKNYAKEMPIWLNKIYNLISTHTINLFESDIQYLISTGENEEDAVIGYKVGKVD